MEKSDLNNRPRVGEDHASQNPPDESHLIGRREQKLIEDRERKLIENKEHKLIEDKGAAAAAIAEVEKVEEPAPARRNWFGWWMAALVALFAVGLCLLFAVRDSKFGTDRTTAATTGLDVNAVRGDSVHAPKTASLLTGATANGAVSGTATASAAATRTASATTTEGERISGSYPVATESLIDAYADNGRTADYIYYFGNDQSAVPDNRTLDEIAGKAEATGAEITVTAYASEVGAPAYNKSLSERRAANLANYLVAHGVAADHVRIKAAGATDRFGDSPNNRRADITVDYRG